MALKIKKITAVLLTVLAVISALPVYTYAEPDGAWWPAAPEISAEGAILIEAGMGTVLFGKNSKDAFYPASTTKLMTVLLALEQGIMSDKIEMSYEAITSIGWDSSRVGLVTGEELSLEDCLYAILLASANEVCYAVAEYIGGGNIDAFIKQMNERAKELGCVNTNYVNPHGLHDENHYTCAYDLALIMKKCIEYTTFNRVSNNYYYTLPATNLYGERVIAQTHQILRRTYKYDGVFAGKTGHTDEAGNCLVTAAKRDDKTLICVVLKEPDSDSCYKDTMALFDYGFENFSLCTVSSSAKDTENAFPILFSDEDSFTYNVQSSLSISDTTLVLPKGGRFAETTKTCTLFPMVRLKKGENIIGEAEFYYAGNPVGKADIIYTSEADQIIDAEALYEQEHGTREGFDRTVYDLMMGKEPEKEEDSGIGNVISLVLACAGSVLVLVVGIIFVFKHRRR